MNNYIGDSGVDTEGTYGRAILPDGFFQYANAPYGWISGAYAHGPDFYYVPGNPERGVLLPNGSLLKPDGTIHTNIFPMTVNGNLFPPYTTIGTLGSTKVIPPPRSDSDYHEKMAMSGTIYKPVRPRLKTLWESLWGAQPLGRDNMLADIVNAQRSLDVIRYSPMAAAVAEYEVPTNDPSAQIQQSQNILNLVRTW